MQLPAIEQGNSITRPQMEYFAESVFSNEQKSNGNISNYLVNFRFSLSLKSFPPKCFSIDCFVQPLTDQCGNDGIDDDDDDEPNALWM